MLIIFFALNFFFFACFFVFNLNLFIVAFFEIVKILIEINADVNIQDKDFFFFCKFF
jgi:hypothetical protein